MVRREKTETYGWKGKKDEGKTLIIIKRRERMRSA